MYYILFIGGVSQLASATIQGEVKKAREIKDKTVIKCTPDGKNGGVVPLKAVQLLKDGMTLLLMPGDYQEDIEIFKNKIILKSEGIGKCSATVKMFGRDCIVKNINLSELYSRRDIVVIDSIISYFSCGSWKSNNNEKVDVYIYNTGLNCLSCEGENNTVVEMKNCLVDGSLECNSNLHLNIENSILKSNRTLFVFSDYDNRKGRVTLKNNLLFTTHKLGKIEYSESPKKQGAIALTIKELKRLWSIILSGENIMKEAECLPGSAFFVKPVGGQLKRAR